MRWTSRRKTAIVEQVENGRLTVEAACQAHDLTPEELASWRLLYRQFGRAGLRTTRLQVYGDRIRTPLKVVVLLLGLLALAPIVQAAEQKRESYSCQLHHDEQRKCAFGSCDKRTLERLRNECLRDGGTP